MPWDGDGDGYFLGEQDVDLWKAAARVSLSLAETPSYPPLAAANILQLAQRSRMTRPLIDGEELDFIWKSDRTIRWEVRGAAYVRLWISDPNGDGGAYELCHLKDDGAFTLPDSVGGAFEPRYDLGSGKVGTDIIIALVSMAESAELQDFNSGEVRLEAGLGVIGRAYLEL